MPNLEYFIKKSLIPNNTTSEEIATAVINETGSGSLVFANSPALTGTPTAPTAAFETNTNQIATTAFVDTAFNNVKTIYETVKNVSGVTLPKGTPLHITGNSGNEAEVIAADAASNYPAQLILNESLIDQAIGQAVAIGFINNVPVPDASLYSAGVEVYLASGGGWTTIKPTGNNAVQKLGVIIRVNINSNTVSGILYGLGNNEDLPNLPQGKIWVGDANGVPTITDLPTGGVTNLSYTASPTNGIVVSDTGTDATITLATGTNAGLLAPADFTKLSNLSGTNTGDQTITLTGDVTGSGTSNFATTLANTTVTPNSYGSSTQVATFTVDSKGRLTAASNTNISIPASQISDFDTEVSNNTDVAANTSARHNAVTLTGTPDYLTITGQQITLNQIDLATDVTGSLPQSAVTNLVTDLSNKQPLDADLTAIAALTGTTGLLRKTAADTYSLDTATYLTSNQTITLSGDITGSGTTAITASLANSGVTAGTYRSVTVDVKGRVTAGTNPTTLAGYGITDALSNSNTSTQNAYFGDIFLYDDNTPSHYLQITNSANLTAARSLSINVNDNNRTVSLSGDLTLANTLTTSGNFALTLTTTGVTNVTLPTSGTLVSTANNLSVFASTTSSELAGVISDETGTGSLVFANSPALTGVPTAPTASPGTNTTQVATTAFVTDAVSTAGGNYLSGSTTSTQSGYFGDIFLYDDTTPSHYLRVTNSANLTAQRTLSVNTNDADRTLSLSGNLTLANNLATVGNFPVTLTATASTSVTLPTTGTLATLTNNLGQFGATTSAQLAGVITDETGTGSLVFAGSPALTGTPTAPTASRATSTTQVATTAFVNPLPVSLSGTTPTIDANTSDYFHLTTSGNTTFTFSAVTSGVTYVLLLELTLGGAHTVTFPASVDWVGGTAPTLNSGTKNILGFVTRDGGTTWNANALTEFA